MICGFACDSERVWRLGWIRLSMLSSNVSRRFLRVGCGQWNMMWSRSASSQEEQIVHLGVSVFPSLCSRWGVRIMSFIKREYCLWWFVWFFSLEVKYALSGLCWEWTCLIMRPCEGFACQLFLCVRLHTNWACLRTSVVTRHS